MSIDPVSLAIEAALIIGQMALTASQKTEGPRLDSTDVSTADYGTPKNYIVGTRWLEGLPIIWADKLHETVHHSKTKGGKYDEYKYDATFMVSIAAHPIDAVLRVRLDKKMVYDATGVGPISPAALILSSLLKTSGGGRFRIYTGAEDQLPDPDYQAWCEDHIGPNSAPAFRGQSTAVAAKLPLEKFANRIPTIDMEVTRTKLPRHPYETRATTVGTTGGLATNGTWMIHWGFNVSPLEWWDLPTRTLLGSAGTGGEFGSNTNVALDRNGTAYWYGPRGTGGLGVAIFMGRAAPVAEPVFYAIADFPIGVSSLGVCRAFDNVAYLTLNGVGGYVSGTVYIGDTKSARDFFRGPDDDVWMIMEPVGSSNQFTLRKVLDPAEYTFTGTVTRSSAGNAKGCYVPSTDEFFICADGRFYRIDAIAMTLTASGAAPWGEADVLPGANPGPDSFWELANEYSLKNGSLIRSVTLGDWLVEAVGSNIHDSVNHAVLARGGGSDHLTWRYLDRFGGGTVTLGDIVAEVGEMAGVSDLDTSALTQAVMGFSWARGPAADILAPLLDIHDSDLVPSGFGIKGRVRGSLPAGTIASTEFVRGEHSRFSAPIVQDTELPLRMTFMFADAGKDDQPNTAVAQRYADAVDSQRSVPIDLKTYRSTPDEAQPLADRNLRRRWTDRAQIEAELLIGHAALEPGDVDWIDLDGVQHIGRVVAITRSGIGLKVKWKRDDPRIHDPNTSPGTPMTGREEQSIFIPAPTEAWVMDVPFTRDSEASGNPVLHYGAGSFIASGFTGALLYQVASDGGAERWALVQPDDAGVWGFAADALGNVVSPWQWDRANAIHVTFKGGSAPTSVSEADINADPTLNQAVIGADGRWEIVQFTTAELQGDGSTRISGFRRGRRGTNGATGSHQVGDLFVMTAQLGIENEGLGNVGLDLLFKGQALGRDPEAARTLPVHFAGAALKPWSPAGFVAARDPVSGDWTFRWHRRSRLGGAWVGGTTVPLSELSERYELTIGDRVIATTVEAATWTVAQQVADFGAPQTSLPVGVNVTQSSDAVGRGFPALLAA